MPQDQEQPPAKECPAAALAKELGISFEDYSQYVKKTEEGKCSSPVMTADEVAKAQEQQKIIREQMKIHEERAKQQQQEAQQGSDHEEHSDSSLKLG